MKVTNTDLMFAVVLALLLWIGRGPVVPVVPPVVPHAPAVVKVAEALRSSPAKAKILGEFYARFAKTGPSAATVAEFAAAHARGLDALGPAVAVPPMVGAEVDAALAEIIGLKADDPLAAKREALAARLADLAAALLEVK